MIARQVIIAGKVQGVGFRAWVQDAARDHGLVGWVRNRADGTVEARFQGDANAVEGMIDACADGPVGAMVTAVTAAIQDVDSNMRQFIILPSVTE